MKILYLRASVILVCFFVAELNQAQEDRRLNLKTYPGNLTLHKNSDAVFDCRDEGPLRVQVQWLRGNHVQVSHRGRLILRHVQARHAGNYTCRALGFARTFAGAEVSVRLQVLQKDVDSRTPSPPRTPRPPKGCTPLEAQCRNGQCVPKEFVCDGEFDCSDGSDELHCKTQIPPKFHRPLKGCTPLEAQCRNGQCVPKEFVCDGEFDCSDGSDELHCKTRARPKAHDNLLAWTPSVAELRAPVACGKNEAPCRNGECLIFQLFCDGEFDCSDGSDEFHCNRTNKAKSSRHVTKTQLRQGDVNSHGNLQIREISKNEVIIFGQPAWGEWSPWGPCNAQCERERGRKCGAAKQSYCEGAASERQKCPMKECQVDGGWGAWTPWTSCSESCGRGTRRRYRKCDNPPPNYGGAYCSGSDGQQENCMQAPCTTAGEWGHWGKWSTCSRGKNGTRTRKRECEVGGPKCQGADVQEAPCSPCPRNLKIGMKPVRLTVTRGRLVNMTCHYRRRGEEPLSLELDLPPAIRSNEVIKETQNHVVVKDSLTATRCGARRRWTLMLGEEHTLIRCIVRDAEGKVLGKVESNVISVSPTSLHCHGGKSCQSVGVPKNSRKKIFSPSIINKDEMKKETPPDVTPHQFIIPPRILQVYPSLQVVNRGGNAQILCLVLGDPPLDIQWRTDGRELTPRAVTSGDILHLRGVRFADAGKYICTARNNAGVSYGYASVVVK